MTLTELLDIRFRSEKWKDWRESADTFVAATTDKRAGRAFAERHGVAVSQLLWSGDSMESVPWDTMPSRYTLKHARGSTSSQVLLIVDGVEVLHRKGWSIDYIRDAFNWIGPIIAEEIVEDESGCIPPIDYKFMCFGGHVESVMVFDRTAETTTCNCYKPDWTPLPTYLIDKRPEGPLREQPQCLDRMIEQASRLGAEFGEMVRCDLYATPDGPVFGEFCCNPSGVRRLDDVKVFHDWANEHLGKVWEENLEVGQ